MGKSTGCLLLQRRIPSKHMEAHHCLYSSSRESSVLCGHQAHMCDTLCRQNTHIPLYGDSKTARKVKHLLFHNDDLSSMSTCHVTPESCPLTSTSMPWHVCPHTQ